MGMKSAKVKGTATTLAKTDVVQKVREPQQPNAEPTVASKRKGVATEGKGAAVEEDVFAIRIQKHVKTHKHKADDGHRQVKKETTFASDENESASGKETTMKEGRAARTTQKQKREQKKHGDRGKEQVKQELDIVSKKKKVVATEGKGAAVEEDVFAIRIQKHV